jgi:hypothetical protein
VVLIAIVTLRAVSILAAELPRSPCRRHRKCPDRHRDDAAGAGERLRAVSQEPSLCVVGVDLPIGLLPAHRFDRKTCVPPCLKPSSQGPDAWDAPAPQQERHPGAASLIGSRAVEDHITVARDLLRTSLQLIRAQMYGSRNHHGIGSEIQRVTKIDDHQCLPGVELSFELDGRDPRDPQVSDEALASDVLTYDVDHKRSEGEANEPGPQVPAIERR